MAEVTASLVKELHEKTGAGMMDCKRALNETSHDRTRHRRTGRGSNLIGHDHRDRT